MSKDTPIICFVGNHHDASFIAAVHEIIKNSGLPIVVVQAEEVSSTPLEFKIPDVKIEDIVQIENLIQLAQRKTKHKKKYNINQKQHKLYNAVRDTRFKIRMQTYNRQRIK